MQDVIIEFLKEINIIQLFAIGVMFWFFYNRLDSKIEKVEQRLKDDINAKIDLVDVSIKKLDDKIEKLSDKVEDIDRRLCRIEGGLSTHGHCLFNQTHTDKKAE